MAMYRGFSTLEGTFAPTKLTNTSLIKRDILNHFRIRQGEKLSNPGFGSSVQDLIMEPLTVEIKNLLVEEITRIIKSDPRVLLAGLIVSEYSNGIQAEVNLTYVQNNQSETLLFNFNNQDGTIS
jgi:phage baseplate assembly protein W